MHITQLVRRSACSSAISLSKTPINPPPPRQPLPHNQASKSSKALSNIVWAALTGTVISSTVVLAHSDVTLSSTPSTQTSPPSPPPPPPPPSSSSPSVQPPPVEPISLPLSPLPDLPLSTTSSPNKSLFDRVSQADPGAVHILSRMVSDPSKHAALLDQNVIQALVDGLSAASRTGPAARPIQLGILRILADLAEHSATHPRFSDYSLPAALSTVVTEIAISSAEPWGHWLQRQFSFLSSSTQTPLERASRQQKEQQLKDQSHPPQLFLMDEPAKPTAATDVDLDAGIAFHTMRCIANLARHTNLHDAILSTPLLTPVCKLLSNLYTYHDDVASSSETSHHYTELLRFCTMAVSALAKSAPDEIISNQAHFPIIALTSQSHDRSIQTFAAGGVRNLTRHPTSIHISPPSPSSSPSSLPSSLPSSSSSPSSSSAEDSRISTKEKSSSKEDPWRRHRELVVAGVANALTACMQPDTPPHTKSFAISAFSDLMTTGHYKAPIIRKRLSSVQVPFTALMNDRNPLVFRAISRCLTSIFEHSENDPNNIIIVPDDLANAIAEQSGLFMNSTFKQHDLSAARAVAAMCRHQSLAQRMLDKGLLQSVRAELSRARGEYWDKCTAIVAQLSDFSEFRKLISQSGIMVDILRRPCLERDGEQVARFLANMAREESACVDIAHHGLRILLTAVMSKSQQSSAVKHGTRALYNISLEGFSRVMLTQNGGIIPLISAAKNAEDKEVRRHAVGALAQISEALEHASTLVEADIVKVLLDAAKKDPSVHRDVARCFAQMSQVTEVHGSLAKNGAAEWIAEMVAKNGGRGPQAGEVLQYGIIAICNLTYSPGITRTVLTEKGALRTLTGISTSGMNAPLVSHGARQALSNLRGNEKPAMVPTDGIPKNSRPA